MLLLSNVSVESTFLEQTYAFFSNVCRRTILTLNFVNREVRLYLNLNEATLHYYNYTEDWRLSWRQ